MLELFNWAERGKDFIIGSFNTLIGLLFAGNARFRIFNFLTPHGFI